MHACLMDRWVGLFSLTAWKQCMCAGVTSFSIDLESKKVTVMGHVSPAGVLESVSKVKKAELLM